MWKRLQCLFFGHEEWSISDGEWFCMRCLKVRIRKRRGQDRTGRRSSIEATLEAFVGRR